MSKLPKPKVGDVVLIEWSDAYDSRIGWHPMEDDTERGPCYCLSVGLFIGYNTNGDLLLASTFDHENYVNHVIARPIKMINSVKILKRYSTIKRKNPAGPA